MSTTSAAPELLAPRPDGPLAPGPTPTFSIVIAAYQAAAFIGGALASALAQTVPAHEIVVCDDGSTDDLDAALAPYRDRIVLVRQSNQGEGAAKSAAARAATGDFVVFLDADDAYLPDRLEQLGAAAAERPDLDVLASNALVEFEGRTLRLSYDDSWTFETEDQRCGILERCFVLGHAAVRRDRFEAVGGFDPTMRTVADWDLWMRLILSGSRAGLLTAPLARYRVRAGSLSTDRRAIVRGGITCLEHAAARDDLSHAERATLGRTHQHHRRELALLEAQQALRDASPDARRRLVKVALGRGYGSRTRAKTLISAIAPQRARAELASRENGTFVGASGVRVNAEGSSR